MMAERGIVFDRSTLHRWVTRRHKRYSGQRWRMDETYSVPGGFCRKAIRHHGEPEVVTVDKSGTNAAALATSSSDKPDEEAMTIRQSKPGRAEPPKYQMSNTPDAGIQVFSADADDTGRY